MSHLLHPIAKIGTEQVVFWITAVISLGSAIAMIVQRKAVHSALFLVLNFFTLSVFYVMLDAHFLAAVQIIVYAGAILVLFLFVIMLLGVDGEESPVDPIRGQRTIAMLGGLVLAGITVYTVRSALASTPFKGLGSANAGGNVQSVGRVLFTKYLFPFEVTSLLLIVAAIGAIVVGRRLGAREEADEPALPEADDVAAARPVTVGEERP